MLGRRFIVLGLALPLLFASGIMEIVGASSAEPHVAGEDVFPPQNSIVIDALAGIPTTTRFEHWGSFGSALDHQQSVGPEFRLIRTTTITEIGAYVESCRLSDPKSIERCKPIPSINVKIYPQLNGYPDLTKEITSYELSNDNDRSLISYESVKVELRLEPGIYYAIFYNPAKHGILMAQASYPFDYQSLSVAMVSVRKDPDSVSTSRAYLAVRILKKAD